MRERLDVDENGVCTHTPVGNCCPEKGEFDPNCPIRRKGNWFLPDDWEGEVM